MKWTPASTAFSELLTLRDHPDPDAASVLEQILDDHRESSSIHRFAAAQALFVVGSADALRRLDAHVLSPGFDGRLAFDYAFHWDMHPADRDGFLDRCVLLNAGEAPALSLTGRSERDGVRQRLLFEIVVANHTDHTIEILDPDSRNGELLVFRAVSGHVARTIHPGTCEHMGAGIVRMTQGESRTVKVVVETLAPIDTAGATYGGLPDNATIAARAGSYSYLLGAPGAYDVVARWTGTTGRSVSTPVRVVVEPLR